MKKLFPSTLFILCLLSSGYTPAFERLSKNKMKGIHAQSGISMAVDSAAIYLYTDSLKISAVDNRDPFGNLTAYEGSVSFDNFSAFAVFDSLIEIDVGLYQAPDEHLVATDVTKRNGIGADKYEHQYGQFRIFSTTIHRIEAEPYYWVIGDDIQRPLDGKYSAVQVSSTNFASEFSTEFTMNFLDKELSHVALSGITMPEFVHNGVQLPGTVLTLYPDGSSINMEVRTRLTIDELKIGDAGNPDLRISGIHFGEAFSSVLPDHLEDTGDINGPGIDTSGWGGDFKSHMYSGYFLIGNLNQVDFADGINQLELYGSTTTKNNEVVQLVANPLSINFGRQSVTGNPVISLSTGLAGSIRIESLQGWNGSDLGPVAVDGIRVKHCVIEFPGGYKHEDGNSIGNFKGRIHPDQLQWLNDLTGG